MEETGRPTSLGKIEERQAEIEAINSEMRTHLGELQEAILQGEMTTGDHIEDGLISLYGAELVDKEFRDQVDGNFRSVEEKLSGKTGEPIIVVHRYHGEPLFKNVVSSGRHELNIKCDVIYAVLADDRIAFRKNPSGILPAQALLPVNTFSIVSEGKQIIEVEGNLPLTPSESNFMTVGRYSSQINLGNDINKPLKGAHSFGSGLPLEIIVGNQSIGEWAEREVFARGVIANIVRAAIAGGVEPPTSDVFRVELTMIKQAIQIELSEIEEGLEGHRIKKVEAEEKKDRLLEEAGKLGLNLSWEE